MNNENNKKKEGLLEEKMERRDFFKNLGKTALPAIALLGLGAFGGKLNGNQHTDNSRIKSSAGYETSCKDDCEGGCKGTCENTCYGSCEGCHGSCEGGCKSCEGTCQGSCQKDGASCKDGSGKNFAENSAINCKSAKLS